MPGTARAWKREKELNRSEFHDVEPEMNMSGAESAEGVWNACRGASSVLADAIAQMALKALNVSHNPIGFSGAQQLLRVYRAGRIRSLNLWYGHINALHSAGFQLRNTEADLLGSIDF